jgi:hypothetical protein
MAEWAARVVPGAPVRVSNRPKVVSRSFRNPGVKTRQIDNPRLPLQGKIPVE